MWGFGSRLGAGMVAIYADGDGKVLGHHGTRETLKNRSGARERFIVDVGRKQSTFSFPLPAKGYLYWFEAEISVGWQVREPWLIVDLGIQEGCHLLDAYLQKSMRSISADCEPDEAAEVERRLNEKFGEKWVQLPEGIEIQGCYARIKIDSRRATNRLRKDDIEIDLDMKDIEHARGRRYLELDPQGMALMAVAAQRDPGAVRVLMDGLRESRHDGVTMLSELINRIERNGGLQDVDVAHLRTELLRLAPGILGPGATTDSGSSVEQVRHGSHLH
jgi:hypothetical protein